MRTRDRIVAIVALTLLGWLSYSTASQLASPQSPPQKLVVLVGEPVQFHIKANGETRPGQVSRVHSGERPQADLVVWDSAKKEWAEHHYIALDSGDVYYTLFR